MNDTQDGEDVSPAPQTRWPHKRKEDPRLGAFLQELKEHRAKVAAAEPNDEEMERLVSLVYQSKERNLPLPDDLSEAETFEERVRATAKWLLATTRVSQQRLAELLGTRQPAVSHMLSGRSYGLTTTEVWAIEVLADVHGVDLRDGPLCPTREPRGGRHSSARHDAGGIRGDRGRVRALESRASGEKELEQMEEESFDRFWEAIVDRDTRREPLPTRSRKVQREQKEGFGQW